jgi:hypothetical protein
MAETSFDRLPGLGIDRVGGPTDQMPNREGRHDPVNHQPLNLQWPPGVMHEHPIVGGPWEEKPKEAATEAQRREELRWAIATHRAAQEALEAARAAHERGRHHLSDCQRHAASFITLQDEVNAATIEQLRGSRGKPDLHLFEGRINDRTRAEIALAAAIESERTLLREQAEAVTRLQRAEQDRHLAVDRVIGFQQSKLFTEATRLAQASAAHRQIARCAQEEWPWTKITEALLADPLNAPLDGFTVPDEPRPEKPPIPAHSPGDGMIRIQHPINEGGGRLWRVRPQRCGEAADRYRAIASDGRGSGARARTKTGVGRELTMAVLPPIPGGLLISIQYAANGRDWASLRDNLVLGWQFDDRDPHGSPPIPITIGVLPPAPPKTDPIVSPTWVVREGLVYYLQDNAACGGSADLLTFLATNNGPADRSGPTSPTPHCGRSSLRGRR